MHAPSRSGDPANQTGGFARRTLLYAAGSVLSRSTGFLLLPLFAHSLTSEEFGAVALAKVIGTFLALGLSLGLPSAAVKKHFVSTEKERSRIYGALWFVLLGCSGALLFSSAFLGERLATLLGSPVAYAPYLQFALVGAALEASLVALPREHMKASGKAWHFVAINGLQTGANVLLVVVFVLLLRQGAQGAMLAHAASFLVAGAFGVWFLWPKATLRLNADLTKEGLIYGLPLVPHLLSHWVLSAADRLLIARELTLADVAVYHVTYQVGSVVLIVAFAGSNALLPMIGKAGPSKEQAAPLGPAVTYYVLAVSGVAIAVTALGPTLVHLLAGPSYEPHASLLPWVCLGFVFVALYSPPVNVLSVVLGKSKTVASITLGAATVNILANLALIPLLGLTGAAIATAVSYLVLFAGFYGAARSGPRIPYEYGRIVAGLLVTAAALAVASTLPPISSALVTVASLSVLTSLAFSGRKRPGSKESDVPPSPA